MKIKYLIFIICVCLVLSGCSKKNEETKSENIESKELVWSVIDANKEAFNDSSQEESSREETEDVEVFRKHEITDEIKAVMERQDKYYIYNLLNDVDKVTYSEILLALLNPDRTIELGDNNLDNVNKIFYYVMFDHSELFWVDGLYLDDKKYRKGVTLINARCHSNENEKHITEYATRINSKIKSYVDTLESKDDYSIIKAGYEYVINNTDYDTFAIDNQNILSVYLYNKSMCAGYCKALQYFLQLNNIECVSVPCKTGDINHLVLLVKLNDKYYICDPTWGEMSYNNKYTNDDLKWMPNIDYFYLCCTLDYLKSTHTFSSIFELPECNDSSYNYYKDFEYYYNTYNESRMKALFNKCYSKGLSYVVIKCNTQDTMNKIITELFTNQKVFYLLRNNKDRVKYCVNSDRNIIYIQI